MPDKICMQPTPTLHLQDSVEHRTGVRPRTAATVRATIGP
jgi:hypothetical protein